MLIARYISGHAYEFYRGKYELYTLEFIPTASYRVKIYFNDIDGHIRITGTARIRAYFRHLILYGRPGTLWSKKYAFSRRKVILDDFYKTFYYPIGFCEYNRGMTYSRFDHVTIRY